MRRKNQPPFLIMLLKYTYYQFYALSSYLCAFNFFFFRNTFVVSQTHDNPQQSLLKSYIDTLEYHLERF